jgi:hypothetical protein
VVAVSTVFWTRDHASEVSNLRAWSEQQFIARKPRSVIANTVHSQRPS